MVTVTIYCGCIECLSIQEAEKQSYWTLNPKSEQGKPVYSSNLERSRLTVSSKTVWKSSAGCHGTLWCPHRERQQAVFMARLLPTRSGVDDMIAVNARQRRASGPALRIAIVYILFMSTPKFLWMMATIDRGSYVSCLSYSVTGCKVRGFLTCFESNHKMIDYWNVIIYRTIVIQTPRKSAWEPWLSV